MALVAAMGYNCRSLNKVISRRFVKSSLARFQLLEYSKGKMELEVPLKYTESKMGHMSIVESLKLDSTNEGFWFKPYVVGFSLFVFMLYFFVFREENDIDQMMKGENQNEYAKLADLIFKYNYCKNNNLPFEHIEKKIQKIKEDLGIKD